jgi:hypothetical protein
MALDPNILLQRTTPDLMSALSRGISAGQSLRQAPILEALNKQRLAEGQRQAEAAQRAQAEAERKSAIEQQQQKGVFVNRLAESLKTMPVDQRQAVIDQNQQALQAFGVDPSRLTDLTDPALDRAIAATSVFIPKAQDKNVNEIRKEARKSIGDQVRGIQNSASVLTTNFGKLSNLVGEIKKGNRSAVAQGLVSLVKLGDPGSVVKEEEMKAALAQQSPVAAVTSLLSGKGVGSDVVDSIASQIDPLNPNNINTDELLSTARALIGANAPTIMENFEIQKERAAENLTPGGMKSIFSSRLEKSVLGLSDILGSQPIAAPVEDPESRLPKGSTKNPDGTFTLPNGLVVEPE